MIGYYAHHHGSGHVTRASSIAAAMDEPLTVLSSRTRPAHSSVPWIDLPLDTDPEAGTETGYRGTTAGDVVHWAPIGVGGLTERMAIIADWVARERPRLFVVDVSVEVAMFVRLMGVDVVVMAMPGERTDEPHRLVYRMASHIIAPWSQSVYDPAWLDVHAAKTTYVGVISRFDGRPREHIPNAPQVLVLGGAGGTALSASDIADAERAHPEYRWGAAGIDAQTWVDDVWPLLCSASVVVTHAGQNAIADVAAARTPAVVIPQDRPFDEQRASASAVAAAGAAVLADSWPSAAEWAPLLDSASHLRSSGWDILRQVGAADRAAATLTGFAP